MRSIPRSFKLMGHDIVVEMRDDLIETCGAYGVCHYHEHRIELQAPNEEFKITHSHLMHTFFHEFFHMALYCLGHIEMSQDEALVDQLGQVVQQLLKTKRN
jgi:hypothetical protein